MTVEFYFWVVDRDIEFYDLYRESQSPLALHILDQGCVLGVGVEVGRTSALLTGVGVVVLSLMETHRHRMPGIE